MNLLPPRVVGPISPCNRAVRVQGQLTHAMVRIFQGNTLLASANATSADQVFPIRGAILPGKPVFAVQNFGAQSPVPPLNERTIPLTVNDREDPEESDRDEGGRVA
jgi:hypothetical protein